ncbi:hypothetical protein ACFQ07_07145, partial [Actinomadura adrarensis]
AVRLTSRTAVYNDTGILSINPRLLRTLHIDSVDGCARPGPMAGYYRLITAIVAIIIRVQKCSYRGG